MRSKIALGSSLALLLGVGLLFYPPILAFAQQEVLFTGQDSSGNTRIVKVDSSGNLLTSAAAASSSSAASPTAHAACTNTTMNVGTTGTNCPSSARTDRSTISIQLIQSGETLTITSDGATVATATIGMQIGNTDVFNDTLVGTVNTNCRCTAATCSIRVVECP